MDDHRLAVFGQVYVGLDVVDPEADHLAEGGEAILQPEAGAPPVGGNGGAN